MATYIVKVRFSTVDTYEVEADNRADAKTLGAALDGKFIGRETLDENEVVEAKKKA